MNQYLKGGLLSLLVFAVASCSKNLNQTPQATATNSAVFTNVQGLQLYSNSFYDNLPSANDLIRGDAGYAGADYGVQSSAPNYLLDGTTFTSRQATGWSWGTLRNINYFIANCKPVTGLTETQRLNYIGLAKFFRAYFYYGMVQKFGNVPWISTPLDVDDSALYATQSPRGLVMDSVLADINFAIGNISLSTDATASQITKWVAYGLKSRICLFEGTFQKYQNKDLTAAAGWLENAASAAKAVMDSSGFSVNQAGGTSLAYRNLFISSAPVNAEVMLSVVQSLALSVLNDANWYYTSGTYGVRYSFTRTFINTYLNIDGTPFTDITGHDTMTFVHETQERDARLAQTIRLGNYQRTSSGKTIAAPPSFSYSLTGYMPIKWSLDDTYYDGGTYNINSICLMRYAEVLLNYAEAVEELKTMGGAGLSAADWTKTIGALRSRAGITGNLALPVVADTYLQTNYFPDITDPVLLEIRRERGIELVLEGFRFADLTRWKHGELLARTWNGMYVPALNVLMDLNGDGTPDVSFYSSATNTAPANPITGVTYVNVSPTLPGGVVNQMTLSDGTDGELHWLDNVPRVWHDYKYLYPIPYGEFLLNPNLVQNPSWQ